MTVEVSGEPFDGFRHLIFREVKAVTAHGMAVDRKVARLKPVAVVKG